jgi:hypothetical protein
MNPANMTSWNLVKTPPETALKQITGGRLKGMTDISPMWRIQVMTEVYGACGIGWTYEIKRTWQEPGAEGQIAAFCEVELLIKDKSEWSRGIPGLGGSMFVAQETRGLYTSDEAYKMALTDALSVAMKAIGVGADIYMGKQNESKYSPKTFEPVPVSLDLKKLTIVDLLRRSGVEEGDGMLGKIYDDYGVNFKTLTHEQANEIIESLQ